MHLKGTRTTASATSSFDRRRRCDLSAARAIWLRTRGRAAHHPHRISATPAMANEQPEVLRRPVVLLFGDSLTERCFEPDGGWGAALAHHFGRKADVLSRGFAGYNSRWASLALGPVLQQLREQGSTVLLATLWLGANDAALPDRSAARQHVPLEEYSAAVDAMAGRMLDAMAAGAGAQQQQQQQQRLVLITPPPVYEEGRVRHQQQRMGTTDAVPPDRTDAAAGRYAQAVAEVGARRNLPVLDLHSLLRREEGWETGLLADGLHFTPAGQALVGRLLVELVQRHYPDLALEALPNQMPWWDKLADAGHQGDLALWQEFLRRNEESPGGGGD